MTTTLQTVVTIAAALGAGIAGGVYLAFPALVLPALRTLPAQTAVAAMQRINISAVRLPFMVVFFGGASASATIIISELVSGAIAEEGPVRMVGAGLALAAVGITIARNVPLNDQLALVLPDSPDNVDRWRSFDRNWSTANNVRAFAAIAASVTLAVSLGTT
ncbi:anthrone oxygenase family protein [Arthrobacter sp. HLT1-20]